MGHWRTEDNQTVLEELLRQHRWTGKNRVRKVFVIDSADETKVEECKEELEDLLSQPKLDKVPLLIFANKQDLTFAATCETVNYKVTLASFISDFERN